MNRLLSLCATMILTPAVAQAAFVPIDINLYANNSNGVVTGAFAGSAAQTLGGVPFLNSGHATGAVWHSVGGGGQPASLTVPVNIQGVTAAYSLINTAWGVAGPPALATVTFDGVLADYVVALVGNADIRDFNAFTYTNLINGTTTVNVFDNGVGQRVDRQAFTLPGSFANDTLLSVRFDDYGADNVQRMFVAGLTLEVGVHAPGGGAVLAGVLGLMALRRRRAVPQCPG